MTNIVGPPVLECPECQCQVSVAEILAAKEMPKGITTTYQITPAIEVPGPFPGSFLKGPDTVDSVTFHYTSCPTLVKS